MIIWWGIIGAALQNNAAQHWLYSILLAANTISNTGKIAKMVHPSFFGEDVGKNPYHSDSENWWLQEVASDEGTCDQNGKPSTPPFPLSSTYYHYFQAYRKPLPMLRVQNTVSPTQYLKKAYHITCLQLGSITVLAVVTMHFTDTLSNQLD